MRVTNDQIDKLTEVCLDLAVRRTQRGISTEWAEIRAEFERQIGMLLKDVKERMTFREFGDAYQRFCAEHGYKS